ncbi:MAG: hypothetical protein N2257_04490 [Thermodesulfovibrionales bacterium]|nr:hypothetical protein [Thermodesulfovibrionales bacterium]
MDEKSQICMIMVKEDKSYKQADIERVLKKDWPELLEIKKLQRKRWNSHF